MQILLNKWKMCRVSNSMTYDVHYVLFRYLHLYRSIFIAVDLFEVVELVKYVFISGYFD